ncbi:MAG: hypothetical protein AB1774_06195 [Bacillota bacterium]
MRVLLHLWPEDFGLRAELLKELQEREECKGKRGDDAPGLAGELLSTWKDGRMKLYLIYKILHCRRTRPELFASGVYGPMDAIAERREHVCAFARHVYPPQGTATPAGFDRTLGARAIRGPWRWLPGYSY